MYGQYNHLQTCDELEIRRLLWGSGVRQELTNAVVTTNSVSNTTPTHSLTPQQFPIFTRASDSQRYNSTTSTMPSSSRSHHSHHRQQQQVSPTGHLHPQYNTAPSPAHTQSLTGFTQSQRLSFIPQPVFPSQDMMPYNLGNKPTIQHQQPIQVPQSPVRTTQVNQRGREALQTPMPSMPNLFTPGLIYSRDTFINFPGGGIFQQQQQQQQQQLQQQQLQQQHQQQIHQVEREDTPEKVESEEDPPANGEDSDDEDYDWGEEEEQEDEDIVQEVTGPYHCGFCQKVYKRKQNYLSHLKEAHNRRSSTPPQKSRHHSSRKTFTPLLPPSQSRVQQQEQQHSQMVTPGINVMMNQRDERREQRSPSPLETPESLNADKVGDQYKCRKCSRKFKTERNYRKHLEGHREKEQQKMSTQEQLHRAISGILDYNPPPQQATYSSPVPVICPIPGQAPAVKLYKCPHCPEFCENEEKLKEHQIIDHKSTKCSDCGDLIIGADFSAHKKRHLIEPKKWKCNKCTEIFDTYKKFKEHLDTHMVEPYKEPTHEFLTRKVPTVSVVVKDKNKNEDEDEIQIIDTVPGKGRPMIGQGQLSNRRPTSLNQAELKRAVRLYTGEKGAQPKDSEEATLIAVVMKNSPQMKTSTSSSVRAKMRASVETKKAAATKKPSSSSGRSRGKSLYADSDPTFKSKAAVVPGSSRTPSKRWRRASPTSSKPNLASAYASNEPIAGTSASFYNNTSINANAPSSPIEEVDLIDDSDDIIVVSTFSMADKASVTRVHPLQHMCVVCKHIYSNNSELTTHILNAHCGNSQVKLIGLENDQELLEFIEIVEEEEY